MKIPKFALQFVYKIAMKNLPAIVDIALDDVKNLDVVAAAYNSDESLEVIIALYLKATESVKDDEIGAKVGEVLTFIDQKVPEILSKVSKEPAKDVLYELIGDLAIPDFDGKQGDEVLVHDLISDIMKELE